LRDYDMQGDKIGRIRSQYVLGWESERGKYKMRGERRERKDIRESGVNHDFFALQK